MYIARGKHHERKRQHRKCHRKRKFFSTLQHYEKDEKLNKTFFSVSTRRSQRADVNSILLKKFSRARVKESEKERKYFFLQM
jgi:hypothetical protein